MKKKERKNFYTKAYLLFILSKNDYMAVKLIERKFNLKNLCKKGT